MARRCPRLSARTGDARVAPTRKTRAWHAAPLHNVVGDRRSPVYRPAAFDRPPSSSCRSQACLTQPGREARETNPVPAPSSVDRRGRPAATLTSRPPLPRDRGRGDGERERAGGEGCPTACGHGAVDCRAIGRGWARHASPLQGKRGRGCSVSVGGERCPTGDARLAPTGGDGLGTVARPSPTGTHRPPSSR